jgi:alpha-amylase
MWPMDLQKIYAKLNNLNTAFAFPENARPLLYQEVIDLGGEAISKIEYNGMGLVTEFLHSRDLGLTFRGKKPLHDLLQWGPAKGFLPSRDALVFVDNHDNQRGHGAGGAEIISYKDKRQYVMATAFMLAHTYGLPRLMSSYEFETSDQGPPHDENFHIVGRVIGEDGQCLSPWVCEHRWLPVANMIQFKNVVGNSTIGNWADNGQNQMAFCRGNLGFIAFNNELSLNFKSNLQTCLPAGTYCDIITGNKVNGVCTGDQIIVDENGKSEIVIPFEREIPVIAVHVGSKLDQ